MDKIDLQSKQYEKDLTDLLSTRAGIRFFNTLIFERCGVLRNSINIQSKELSEFIEGQRAIGLQLLDDIARADSKKSIELFTNLYNNKAKEIIENE